jgi:arginase
MGRTVPIAAKTGSARRRLRPSGRVAAAITVHRAAAAIEIHQACLGGSRGGAVRAGWRLTGVAAPYRAGGALLRWWRPPGVDGREKRTVGPVERTVEGVAGSGWFLLGAPWDSSGSGRGEAHAPAALRSAGLARLVDGDCGDAATVITDPRRDPVSGGAGPGRHRGRGECGVAISGAGAASAPGSAPAGDRGRLQPAARRVRPLAAGARGRRSVVCGRSPRLRRRDRVGDRRGGGFRAGGPDRRGPDGAGPDLDQLAVLLAPLARSSALVGVSVTDLRPDLDPGGHHAARLVDLLDRVLVSR